MPPYSYERNFDTLLSMTKRQWIVGALLFIVYVALFWASHVFFPSPTILFPATAVALSVLFLEGVEVWPFVYLASLTGTIFFGVPLASILIVPIAHTLTAYLGATLLLRANIDPLFRRFRDMSLMFLALVLVAFIPPTLGTIANYLTRMGLPAVSPALAWSPWYVATLFCLLVITPFLLRWFSKSRFNRTWQEAFETITVFVLLLGIDYGVFFTGMKTLAGISLMYFLLIPLFWIALRLRPRFATLAILVTSLFAVVSLFIGPMVPLAGDFASRLYGLETFLMIIAVIFFILVSLEEDRRLTTNLIKSQVSSLENAVSRISSESKAKNDFIAVLAHELRNPLAPIASAIDFLRSKDDLTDEERKTLAMMDDRMQTIKRLLDDLLDVSRISEGKLTVKKEVVDIGTVLNHAAVSTTHHFKERHQSLAIRLPEEPLYIEADPIRMEQVFSNLLTNASKFSDGGDRIVFSAENKDGFAEITIVDHGVGIEPDMLENIFTPFHQIEQGNRSKKGLGIGLALVRSFVEMHDGTVTASSRGANLGSTFTIQLPLTDKKEKVRIDATPDEIRKEASRDDARRKEAKGPHVLVVDDNDAAAWGIGKLLELRGCVVDYAYDGRQAIEKVADLNPDIVILDVGLPDQDGYSVAKTLRARGYHGRLIALTGYNTEGDRAKGKEVGFEHHLVKPAGFADLKRVIPEIA